MKKVQAFWQQLRQTLRRIFGPFLRWLAPYWHAFWRWFRRLAHRFQFGRWVILVGMIAFLVLSGYLIFVAKTADVANLKANLETTTTIYDHSNQKAGSLYSQKGTYVSYDKISPQLRNAVIATEDRSFWTNWGFSIKGYARAAVSLVIHHGQISGGGSTLTQQLAKNALLTQKQTFSRKLEELFLAIEINKVYSKKDIITMYLNNAYFGNGVWGVHDASEKYFGQTAQHLSAANSASLIAMLRNPTFYDPIKYPKNNVARRNLILGLMVTTKEISQQQADTAKATSLSLNDTYQQSDGYKYPYYFDAVVDEAIDKYGLSESDVMNKGYKIYTSLNQSQQKGMEDAFETDSAFPANASDGTQVQGGSVAVNPKTGGVTAVVGGRGTHIFRGYNRATQIERQPGSTMKPLAVYTPALQNGYHYDSSLTDKKLSYGSNKYTPTDYGNVYYGKVPMYTALAKSLNAPAVWLLDQIGVQKGVQSVKNFGINLPKSDQNLALALGGLKVGVSPYQMAGAYTAFANNGQRTSTHFIRKIEDASGNIIVDNTKVKTKKVMSTKVSTEMTSMLMGVFNHGTGQTAKPSGYTVAGKTGSTEVPDSYGYGTKDQWIVGYTPDVVVATWIGFDNTNKSHFLAGISEEGVAPLWKLEMTNILPNTAQTSFKTKDAQNLASAEKSNNSSNSSKWWSGVKSKVNEATSQAGNWLSGIKGLFE